MTIRPQGVAENTWLPNWTLKEDLPELFVFNTESGPSWVPGLFHTYECRDLRRNPGVASNPRNPQNVPRAIVDAAWDAELGRQLQGLPRRHIGFCEHCMCDKAAKWSGH